MATEADFIGKRHGDIGIGAHGIHALDDVLDNRLDLWVSGKFQHFISLGYIIILLCFFKC